MDKEKDPYMLFLGRATVTFLALGVLFLLGLGLILFARWAW